MNELFIYSLILGFALSGDLLFLGIGAGVAMHPYSFKLSLKASLLIVFFQAIMAVFALNIGFLLVHSISNFNKQVGIGLLAFVGMKFILEAFKIQNDQRTFLIEDFRVLFSLAIAASFNSVFAFLGMGLVLVKFTLVPLFALPFIGFFTLITGIFLGNKYRPQRFGRFSKIAAGIFFLIFSAYLTFN
jgi:putative Mn2+ efflux pump MntP